MADQKLTQLIALATLSTDDLFYVVDDPAGAALSRKMAASVLDSRYLQSANNLSDLASRQTALDTLTNVAAATNEYVLTKDTATGNAIFKAATGGAPSSATYIVQTPDATLTNEQALSALATGILKNTTATGVLSIAAEGTDYFNPPFLDTNTLIKGSVDATKLLRFEVDGFTAGATRVLTPPNANATIAGLEVANIFTTTQTVNAGGTSLGGYVLNGTSNPAFTWQNASSTKAYFALATSANAFFAGTAVNDIIVRSEANRIIMGKSGSVAAMIIDGTAISTGGEVYTGSRLGVKTGAPAVALHILDSADVPMRIACSSPRSPGFDLYTNTSTQTATFGAVGAINAFVPGSAVGDLVFRTDIASTFFIWAVSNPSNLKTMSLSSGGLLNVFATNAATNTIVNTGRLTANSTGTALAGFGVGLIFGGESSTTDDTDMGRLTFEWATATHASRKALGRLTAFDITTEREAIQWGVDGTNPTLGFLGATRIARPTTYTLAATATRTMPTPEATFTGQDNLQVGNVYAKFADLATLQTRLDSVEGVLRQVIIDLASTSGYGLLIAS